MADARAAAAVVALAAFGGAAWWWWSRAGRSAAAPLPLGQVDIGPITLVDQGAPAAPAAQDTSWLDEITVSVEKMADTVMDTFAPRGMRNNNPGNLRWIADPAKRWRGMVGQDAAGYATFDTLANGVRAIVKQLQVYQSRGLRSVRAIVSTWAPASENDTVAYVAAVCGALGVGPDVVLDVNAVMPALVAAIARHENGRRLDGRDWLAAADIAAGIQAAAA